MHPERACSVTAAVIVLYNTCIHKGVPLPQEDITQAVAADEGNILHLPGEIRDDMNGRLVRSRSITYF